MSIFKANKKWLSVAQTAMSNAEVIAEQQKDINFGRELLANIRQYRIEQAAVDQAEASIGATRVSGVQTARQFLQQQFNEPYSRTLQDAERMEQIEAYQNQAQAALDRFKKQAKTARTTGYISAIALGAVGGFLGAGLVASTAATMSTAAGAGAVTALGAAGGAAVVGGLGSLAVKGIAGADRNYMSGAIQGTTTATIAAGTLGYGAGSAGFATSTTSGAITKAGAAGTHSWASVGAAEAVSTQGWSASQMFSAANTVFNRLDKDMQYLSQDPQLRVQLRGFA